MDWSKPQDNGTRNFQKKILLFGFVQSFHDNYLFVLKKKNVFFALIVYVDGILVIGNNNDEIDIVKRFLHKWIYNKRLGTDIIFFELSLFKHHKGS